MVFVYHAFSISVFEYLIPAFLIIASYTAQNRPNFSFRAKDILLAVIVSLTTLLPVIYFMSQGNKGFSLLPAGSMFFQFFGVSLPEEVYFRGFLQESLCRKADSKKHENSPSPSSPPVKGGEIEKSPLPLWERVRERVKKVFSGQRLGNNIKSILLVSALFSLMHLPQTIFYGDSYPLLTFFPSLIMGFLYMRTSNILPSVIFHFLANVVWLGMR